MAYAYQTSFKIDAHNHFGAQAILTVRNFRLITCGVDRRIAKEDIDKRNIMNFPFGVNRVNAQEPHAANNPFAIGTPQPPEIPVQGLRNPHGSPERRGLTRARSRERGERGAHLMINA